MYHYIIYNNRRIASIISTEINGFKYITMNTWLLKNTKFMKSTSTTKIYFYNKTSNVLILLTNFHCQMKKTINLSPKSVCDMVNGLNIFYKSIFNPQLISELKNLSFVMVISLKKKNCVCFDISKVWFPYKKAFFFLNKCLCISSGSKQTRMQSGLSILNHTYTQSTESAAGD